MRKLCHIYFIRTNYTQPGLNRSFSKWQSWFKIYFTKNVSYQQQGTIHQNVFSTSCKFYFSGSLVIDSLTLVLCTYVFLTSGITYGAVFFFKILDFISQQKQTLVKWICVSAAPRVPLFCSYHILTSMSWLNYCTIPSLSWMDGDNWWNTRISLF